MTDIPENIMASAQNVINVLLPEATPIEYDSGVYIVARAIMAERERCAKIAERFGAERAGASDGQTYILRDVNGRDVAAAIRSQS